MPCDRRPQDPPSPLEEALVVEVHHDPDARALEAIAEFLVDLYFEQRSRRAEPSDPNSR